MKEKILEHIKEVCDLKKPVEGAEVALYKYSHYTGEGSEDIFSNEPIVSACGIICKGEIVSADYDAMEIAPKISEFVNGIYEEGVGDVYDFFRWEIIGLPVQLNNLLWAIQKADENVDISVSTLGVIIQPKKFVTNYDFTKSVEQNLENPELCKLVGELLEIKE